MLHYRSVHRSQRCVTPKTVSVVYLIQPVVQAHNRVVVWHRCTHRLHLHHSITLYRHRSEYGHDVQSCTQADGNGGGALHQARHGDWEGIIVCVPVEVLQHLLPHVLEVPAQEDGLHHPAAQDLALSGTHCRHNTCDAYRRSQAFGASGMASDSCQICSKRHSSGALSCYSAPMLYNAKDTTM
jgi:hypothetical protein